MILSYHPFFYGHVFRFYAGRSINARDKSLMKKATGIILPQGRLPELHAEAVRNCTLVFPDYSCRYLYPGKVGDIQLFQDLGLPHPRTDIFASQDQCSPEYWEQINYPVVIKHNTGGEGRLVYFVHNPQEARQIMDIFAGMEKSGFPGFLVQEVVRTDHGTLRVVVMHNHIYSYWRVQPQGENFKHNLAQGGKIDWESSPDLQARGRDLTRRLCAGSGMNLAGIDILFDRDSTSGPSPLLLEINYFFAYHGLGGLQGYHELLKKALREWLVDHELPLPPKDFG